MELSDYRKRIDEIDEQLAGLFAQRMEVCAAIAEYKRAHGLTVTDAAREQERLDAVCRLLPEELRDYGEALWKLLMDLSKDYQREHMEDAAC